MGFPKGWTQELATESDLGVTDCEIDYANGMPEAWINGTWEDGIDRTARLPADQCNKRLRALGNAVVPQVVCQFGKALMATAAEYGGNYPDDLES
jgi:hypothetical protein